MKNTGSAPNESGANSQEEQTENTCLITLQGLTAKNANEFILVQSNNIIAGQNINNYYFISTSIQHKFFGLDKCPKTNATEEYKALYLKDLSDELQREVIKLTDRTDFNPFFAKAELQCYIKNGSFTFKTVATNPETTLIDFKNLISRYPLQLNTVIDEHGNTALSVAAENGHIDIVNALLDKEEIKVNAVNQHGDTALICAAAKGHIDIVKALLGKEGIDVDVANDSGYTALICAVSQGCRASRIEWGGFRRIVSNLLAKGADVNAVIQAGYTALKLIEDYAHVEYVDYASGYTYRSSRLIDDEMVNLLISNGAKRHWSEFLVPAGCFFLTLWIFIANIFIAAPLSSVVGAGLFFVVSTIYLSQLVFPKITASYVVSPSVNPLQAGSIYTATKVGTNSADAEARKDSVNSDDGATEEPKDNHGQLNEGSDYPDLGID
ncbi:MAG: ankyrin repeat domain-containing protein [Legionellales bacterium]|nr:ankyrin repeat domain-containing protein [Legionellales bacterium]